MIAISHDGHCQTLGLSRFLKRVEARCAIPCRKCGGPLGKEHVEEEACSFTDPQGGGKTWTIAKFCIPCAGRLGPLPERS